MLNFLRNIYIYIHVYLGNIVIGGILILASFFVKKPSFYNGLVRAWGKWAMLAMPGKAAVNGLENLDPEKPCVIIANHESTVDVFFLLGKLPVPMRMVAKEELQKSFILGKAMERSGFIFVDNKVKGRSIDHLNAQFEKLKKEKLFLMVFPEGSRFKDQLLAPFRLGAFVMAIQNNMPIVPVVLKGPREMMPPESKGFRHSDIRMDILPPVDIAGYTYEDRHELMEHCYQLMHDHLKAMHQQP